MYRMVWFRITACGTRARIVVTDPERIEDVILKGKLIHVILKGTVYILNVYIRCISQNSSDTI